MQFPAQTLENPQRVFGKNAFLQGEGEQDVIVGPEGFARRLVVFQVRIILENDGVAGCVQAEVFQVMAEEDYCRYIGGYHEAGMTEDDLIVQPGKGG